MSADPAEPTTLLDNSLRTGRIHSAYLVSGAGEAPLQAALRFARGIACTADPAGERPCGLCPACRRSTEHPDEVIELDGSGERGPTYRHIGDHADLYYVGVGAGSTRVRIRQIRDLQHALRLGSNEGGWRAAVIADAELLNAEAQNALLRLLEEPPARTSLILVAPSASALLATIRSRCVRVVFPAERRLDLRAGDLPPELGECVERLDEIGSKGLAHLLDWAEAYRGQRATAAERVDTLLTVASEWLRERVTERAADPQYDPLPEVDAFKTVTRCRTELLRRNANPQMVAERGLIAIREALAR